MNTLHDVLKARITELEIKSSFAEDLIDGLNTAVYRQQQQIDLLVLEIRSLRQQIRSNFPEEARLPQDEIPPHY